MPFNAEKRITKLWAQRPRQTHKGLVGRVLVVGGSPEYAGAAILAAAAASRSGCGKVGLAAPEKVVQAANAFCPDVIGHSLAGRHLGKAHLKELQRVTQDYDVVLVGNGAGKKSIPLLKMFIRFLMEHSIPCVLDATAFDALKGMKLKMGNCILLPHVGEFRRWAGVDVR